MWYSVTVYQYGRGAILLDMQESEVQRLEREWENVWSGDWHDSFQRYDGRTSEAVEMVEENGKHYWDEKMVSCHIKMNLNEITGIEVHEAMEQGE